MVLCFECLRHVYDSDCNRLGQLVCIFRSLPRVVKDVPQDLSVTPAIPSRESDGVPRLFRSPLIQLADAVRRLAGAANDHSYDYLDPQDSEDTENVLRLMNNLLAFSHSKAPSAELARPKDNAQNNFSVLKRTTIVHIADMTFVVGAHKSLAEEYTLTGSDPTKICAKNAQIARLHFRTDHERVFSSLAAVLKKIDESTMQGMSASGLKSREWVAHRVELMITAL